MSNPAYTTEGQFVFDDPDPDVIGVYRIVYLPKGYGPDPNERVVWETPWRRGEGFGEKLPARVRSKFDELTASLPNVPIEQRADASELK